MPPKVCWQSIRNGQEEARCGLSSSCSWEGSCSPPTLYLRLGMRSVDVMSGREFEKYVAARVREMGWDVSATPATGDFGVDLIAERGTECVAIQCKRHARPVGVSAVQQVVAGALHHRCSTSAVVSNQEFTTAAKELASTHGCHLVGRSKLRTWKL
jgi:restriction system protein